MLEYLVTSKTRRSLLACLWRAQARGSVASLARQAGVPVGASYAELRAMSSAGLARETLESGRVVYEANHASPYAAALTQLMALPEPPESAPMRDHDSDLVRAELAAQGAPLWGSSLPRATAHSSLEDLLAQACVLAHRDPSVAKVLPDLFLRRKNELQFELLERALTERRQKHTAGFLLSLAAELSGDATARKWAERLRDKRRTKVQDFFESKTSKRLEQLAERNTPKLARKWKFRLNMPLDEFRNVMEKRGESVRS